MMMHIRCLLSLSFFQKEKAETKTGTHDGRVNFQTTNDLPDQLEFPVFTQRLY